MEQNSRNSGPNHQPGLKYTHHIHTKSEQEEPTMTTGWKAASESRRPHSKAKLKKHPSSLNPSKKKRTSVADSNRALRLKGLL